MGKLSRLGWLFCLGAVTAGCVADEEVVDESEVAQSATRVTALYTIRLHAIATADDDGANKSPVTAETITAALPELNAIYAPNRIRFVFDPATDFETRNSTLLNQVFSVVGNVGDYHDPDTRPTTMTAQFTAARRAAADQHRDKVTVFFASPRKLAYSKSLGAWYLAMEKGGGSSGRLERYVAWKREMDAPSLAHELGHYLHVTHTFVEGLETVADVTAVIEKWIQAGHPVSEGLLALDADRTTVLDTPPDAGAEVFKVYGDPCGTATLPVPVTYNGNQHAWFTVAPDRGLVMSYFKGCPFEQRFTPNQITRQVDALRLLNRRNVVQFTPPSATPVLKPLGTASAGPILQVQMTRIGEDRVVTATTGGATLKLIVWDVNQGSSSSLLADGVILRRGEIVVDDIAGPFAITHGGLDQVVVAYRNTSGGITLKSYGVTAAGTPELRSTVTGGGITDVAIAQLDRTTVMTPTRLDSGVLRTIVWEIDADGTLTRRASADGGAIDSVEGVTPFNTQDTGPEATIGGATTFARGTAGNLVVQTWKVTRTGAGWSIDLQDTDGAGAIGSTSATDIDFDLSASVVQTGTDVEKVIAWRSDYTGTITRAGDFTAGPCTSMASAAIGVSFLATACRRPSDAAQVIAPVRDWTERGHGVIEERVDRRRRDRDRDVSRRF